MNNYLVVNKDRFTLSFLIFMPFISFPGLIAKIGLCQVQGNVECKW